MSKPTVAGLIALLACILVCQLAGAVGAVFTVRAVPTWYATLEKPPVTPPGWVFAPVWMTLYTLMGTAAFLVRRRGLGQASVKLALILFIVQLVLNAAWPLAFFGMRSTVAGLVVILPLGVAIVATMAAFARVSTPAALLLVPYLLWVTYATVLNAWIWVLNG